MKKIKTNKQKNITHVDSMKASWILTCKCPHMLFHLVPENIWQTKEGSSV